MNTTTEPVVSTAPIDLAPAVPRERVAGSSFVAIVVLALATVVAALYSALREQPGDRGVHAVIAAVAIVWSAAAVVVARVRREPLAMWCAVIGGAIAAALTASVEYDVAATSSARVVRGLAIAAIPALVSALVVVLPDGRIIDRVRRVVVALFAIGGLAFGIVAAGRRGELRAPPIWLESVVFGFIGVGGFLDRYRRASAVERARLQWAGWGVVVSASATAGVWLLRGLVGWPGIALEVTIASTAIVPVAIALGALERLSVRVDRLLAATIEAGGLMVMVGAVYVIVVLGFGDAPHQAERRVLGLSMIAAIIAAVLYAPARLRLHDFANRRVYGERRAPDEPLQTFGARMSRAIPLEELLLQLAESLK